MTRGERGGWGPSVVAEKVVPMASHVEIHGGCTWVAKGDRLGMYGPEGASGGSAKAAEGVVGNGGWSGKDVH